MDGAKIAVAVRVRPLNARETAGIGGQYDSLDGNVWLVSEAENSISLKDKATAAVFSFDAIYNTSASTLGIYSQCARDLIASCCQGVNATIFAYGQTSSGKTFTMSGDKSAPGIISLAINDIFTRISSAHDLTFTVKVSYLEIYNEIVNDLLTPANTNLKINEHITRGVYVGGLTEVLASSPEAISTLNLVDLAGSERAAHTGAEGKRLKEGGSINKSLLALATVIGKLSEVGENKNNTVTHIPYRNSKITRILQPSLGGNARTLIICTVTPSAGYIDETISTLKFASRAKSIRNKPIVNEIVRDDVLIKQYREEINLLKNQLNQIKGSPAISFQNIDRTESMSFIPSDEFRQSYPYNTGFRQTPDLLTSNLTSVQCEEIKQAMKSTARLGKLISNMRFEIASRKSDMLSFITDIQHRNSKKLMNMKTILKATLDYATSTEQRLVLKTGELESRYLEMKKTEARLTAEASAKMEAETQLVRESNMRDRLGTIITEERDKLEAVSNELSISKSNYGLITKKLDDLVEVSTIQFQLPSNIEHELKGLINALAISPQDCTVSDFLSVLEDIKEFEIKKVYNDLRSVFEEGKQALNDEIEAKNAALKKTAAVTEDYQSKIVILTKELESRGLDLHSLQKMIEFQSEQLSNKREEIMKLHESQEIFEIEAANTNKIVKQKLFDLTNCLLETFDLAESENNSVECLRQEVLNYFEDKSSVV
ncbi:hypothetical protein HK100_003228, partial [Physocladia obscura]